jgi:bifunctional DNA-binding transcriptional regulator/antitoxin component of YhaV-PrlF toxin-antitoxin module
MTGTVNSKGVTVVPKALRERFQINSGASLDWQEDGASLRGIKLEPRREGSFLEGLRRLGRVLAAPRDKRALPSCRPHLKSLNSED